MGESYKVTNLTTPLEDVELVPSSGTAFNGEEQILTAMLFTHTFGLRLVSLNCSSQAIQWYPQVRVSPVNMAYAPDHGMIIGIAGGGIVPVDAFLSPQKTGPSQTSHRSQRASARLPKSPLPTLPT